MKTNFTAMQKSLPSARNEAVTLLARIGVHESDVLLDRNTGTARLWFHQNNGKEVEIRCSSQRTSSGNLAAVIIWLKSRVINVERGIETLDNAFSGYLRLTGQTFEQQGVVSNEENAELSKTFAVLELSLEASNEEIKRKYKLLAGMYHPDNTRMDENKPVYEEKMSTLNAAFDQIKKHRGI